MRRFVCDLVREPHVTEVHAVVVAQLLVVVPGDEHHLVAVLGVAENGSNDVVVRLGPEGALGIDQEPLALDVAQEVEQGSRAAAAEAKVDIGDDDGAIRAREASTALVPADPTIRTHAKAVSSC